MRADADTRIDGSLAVVTNRIGISAVDSSRHHEPDNQRHDNEYDCRKFKAEQAGFSHIDKRPVELEGRLFAIIHENQAAIAQHGAERDDEGIDTGFPDDQTIDRTQCHTGDQGQAPGNRDDPHFAERGEHRPGLRIQHDNSAESKDRAHRQIDITVDHDYRHAQRDDTDGCRLLEQQQHVVDIHELGLGKRQETAGH